jgi:replication factor C subunit 2/4
MDVDDKENKPSQSSKPVYQVPWIEKFRPQKLEDVVGNEETLIRLQAIAQDGNLPNLILCGPPGTGKVSHAVIQ